MEERVSFSRTTKEGLTEEIKTRKVENGYVTCVCKYGEDKDGKYTHEEKEYISKTNPLMKEEEKIETPLEAQKKVYDLLDGFF